MNPAPPYHATLQDRLDRLSPPEKKIRLALTDYLMTLRKRHRYGIVYCLRRLAEYLRFHPDRWPRAVERLFVQDHASAVAQVLRYHRWLETKQLKPGNFKNLGNQKFVVLSRELRRRGAIGWELKSSIEEKTVRRWASCSEAFRTAAHQWLRNHHLRLRPRSHITYRDFILNLGVFLGQNKIDHLQVSQADALRWLEEMKERIHEPTGLNRAIRIAQWFYDWLRDQKQIQDNPFQKFRMLRTARKLPTLLDEKEMARVISKARRKRDRAILEVLYASGCRLGELRSMDVEKISFRERTARAVGKGGHDRVLYLNQSALAAIQAYLPERSRLLRFRGIAQERALFLSFYGSRLGATGVKATVDKAVRAAGLSKRVTSHLFRHAFATHLLNRGADIYSLSQMLGHKDIRSTIVYLQVATERLSAIHRKYHPRR